MVDGDGSSDVSEEARATVSDLGKDLRGAYGTVRDLAYQHRGKLSIIITATMGLTQILFQDELEEVIPSVVGELAAFLTSNSAITLIGFTVVALQAWSLKRIFAVGASVTELYDEIDDQRRTDGGRRQPRDSKGRFQSSDSGPSIIFALAVLALGFIIGSQYGESEALIGVVIALVFLLYTNNI